MRLASCEHEGRRFAAEIEGDRARPLEGIAELGATTPAEVLEATVRSDDTLPVSELTIRPVVPNPGKVLCVGLNYQTHVTETKRETPTYPVLFVKFASSLVGAYDRIPLPTESKQIDFEGEMAVVIGRTGRRIDPADAFDHIAGFTVANDVTMRDYQYKTHQWLQGKAWDSSCPVGPYLVTLDELPDIAELSVTLEMNGETMQSASLGDLMFDIPTLVSIASEFTTLNPGDLILTGTPGGVGFRRDPQVFIEPGDRITVDVPGVGRIDNEFFAEVLDDTEVRVA